MDGGEEPHCIGLEAFTAFYDEGHRNIYWMTLRGIDSGHNQGLFNVNTAHSIKIHMYEYIPKPYRSADWPNTCSFSRDSLSASYGCELQMKYYYIIETPSPRTFEQ
jgi:hypothetical protein